MFQTPLMCLHSTLKRLPQTARIGSIVCLLVVPLWLSWMVPAIAQPLVPTPLVASLFHFSGSRPTNLGIHDGKLAPCPATPNCVSSQAQDDNHAIAALRYTGSPETAFTQLKSVIQSLPRTKIIQEGDGYLYAEFTSALMGYVDDVEFYRDPNTNAIQVRSASRLGESDLGVNRQRIEAIRAAL